MKLGKVHLVLSLLALAASVVYTAWTITRPAARTGGPPAEAPLLDWQQGSGPSVTGEASAEAVDPTTLPPLPDIGLDRAPEWPRNPFINARLRLAEVPLPSGATEAEPGLVLASILHSAQRRLAIVDGRIVRVGDRIGSVTVREIEPRAVVVESEGGARRVLELRVPMRRIDR